MLRIDTPIEIDATPESMGPRTVKLERLRPLALVLVEQDRLAEAEARIKGDTR